MRTVVVYRGKRTRPEDGKGDDRWFLIWKLVAESGIGFEEIHYTTLSGDPTDPGEYTELGFEFTAKSVPGDPGSWP